jgi:hypothetical protein
MSTTHIPPIVQALCDGHALYMTAGGLACRWLDRVKGDPTLPVNLRILEEAGRIANLSARIAERKLPLQKLWQDHGHRPGMRELGAVPVVAAPVPASPPRPKLHAAAGQSRGRLRHGNPSGDFRASPRCGARTRSGGCCRQPAMPNGRCRMHGGRSTGPRTPEGLKHSRHSRFVHGFRSQPVLDFRRRMAGNARDLTRLAAAARLALRGPVLAGHGVHRPDSLSAAAFTPAKVDHRDHRDHGGYRVDQVELRNSGNNILFSVTSVPSSSSQLNPSNAIGVHRRLSAVDTASLAGQGVHRSNVGALARRAAI